MTLFTIDHEILLEKLYNYGIRGNAFLLLKSYLSNRKQLVSVLGEISDHQTVIFGVPQGSCLSPLLFLIYINDINIICNTSELILFADDTNIFVKSDSKQNVYEKANIVLEKLYNYTELNKLHINIDKSCFIHFAKHGGNCMSDNDTELPLIKTGPNDIEKVSETKSLLGASCQITC